MTTVTIDNYYKILGLEKNASVEDIHKAYRKMAKTLHPDVNKSPDAHENFILLNEAYEYLLKLKNGELDDQTQNTYTAQPEAAGARAQQYAKRPFARNVTKSEVSIDIIATHLMFFIAITVVVIVPIVGAIIYGIKGFGIGLLIDLCTSPVTIPLIRGFRRLNMTVFSKSVQYIIKTNGVLIPTVTIVNIFIILKFVLQTLIIPWLFISIYFIAGTIAYLINKSKKEKSKIYFNTFCIAPLVVNLFIILNFSFSSNPVKETYGIRNDIGYQASTYIHLEKDDYDQYPGIRLFSDYGEMAYKQHITYTFETGILGLRIMTDYEFRP